MSRRYLILGIVAFLILGLVGAGVVILGRQGGLTTDSSRGLDTGETPAQTADPTQTLVPATATPNPVANWRLFKDPFQRYSLQYPPTWFVRESQSESPGFASASYISSFDLAPLFEEMEGEIVVPPGEFLIGLEFIPEDVSEARLEDWVRANDSGIAKTIEIYTTSIGETAAVVKVVDFGSDYTTKLVYLTAPGGVLVVSGERTESAKAEVFELLLSTIEIE